NVTDDIYNYVTGWSSTRSNYDDISIRLPTDHEFFKSDMHAWKLVNDELVFDEDKQQQLVNEREKEESKPNELDISKQKKEIQEKKKKKTKQNEIDILKQENEKLAMALMDLAEITLNIGGED